MSLKITDVASHQGNYKFGSFGEDGIIIKATGGVGYVNPKCDYVAQQAITKGATWGLYHYAGDGNGGSAKAEADHFVKNIKGYLSAKNKPILILDWESTNGDNPAWGNGAWANDWVSRVHELTGVMPGLYTGSDGVNQCGKYLANKSFLWFAGYPTMADVGWSPSEFMWSTGAWKVLTGWQFSSTPIDKSFFYVDKSAWAKLAGSTSTPTEPSGPTEPSKPNTNWSPNGKSLEVMANDTINGKVGKVGDGDERKALLGGYYTSVQAIINEKVASYKRSATVTTLKNETLSGKLGNGDERKRLLGGYYNEVQSSINGSSKVYVVKSGDTLSGIGAKLGVDWNTLASKNGIKSPYTIYAGQKLNY